MEWKQPVFSNLWSIISIPIAEFRINIEKTKEKFQKEISVKPERERCVKEFLISSKRQTFYMNKESNSMNRKCTKKEK